MTTAPSRVTEPFLIRLARLRDQRALCALCAHSFGHLGDYSNILSADWLSDEVRCLVAERGGQLLGFQSWSWQAARLGERVAELRALSVVDSARRQGVGRALFLASLRDIAARSGGKPVRLVLDIATDNPAAQALVTSHGFTPTGRAVCYPRGQTGLGFEKLLTREDGE